MFRVLEVGPEGPAIVSTGPDRVHSPPAGVVRWVDLSAQDGPTLALLQERFGLHPLTIEDCAHFGQRPKLEEYAGHVFVVTQGFALEPEGLDVNVLELHAFLGDRWLVTVHSAPLPALEEAWKRAAGDPSLARRGADFLYYLVADGVVDACFPVLDQLSDELEAIEDAVLEGALRSDLARIFRLKGTLVTLRKVLAPQRDVIALLTKRGSEFVHERTALYLRDVYDHLVRIHESVETGRDLLGNVLDAHLTMASNRTNEIMKRLTILSSIFLPLSFVTGFFGQNFEGQIPFDSRLLFWVVLGTCALIPVAMLTWFRRSGWL